MSVFAFTALSAFSFAMAEEAALEGGFVVGALLDDDFFFALKPSFICEK
jgi:hypothetical protein